MAIHNLIRATTVFSLTFLILLSFPHSSSSQNITTYERSLLVFALNLIYLEGTYFFYGASGKRLQEEAPEYVGEGPPPIGAQKANLDNYTQDIFFQFGYQNIGQFRAIKELIMELAPTPLLNISQEVFAEYMDNAFQRPLVPPFNPYANSLNFLIGAYLVDGIGPPGIVGANPALLSYVAKAFVAALLGINAGQYAVIRTLLYERRNMKVSPYEITVAEFADHISDLRNRLANAGLKDEGLVVPRNLGAEGKVEGNILDGDQNSLTYSRGIQELLRIAYGGGNEHVPGGFFPKGANGVIAKSFLLVP